MGSRNNESAFLNWVRVVIDSSAILRTSLSFRGAACAAGVPGCPLKRRNTRNLPVEEPEKIFL